MNWEIEKNDPRLCVKGTEHLYSIVTKHKDGNCLVIVTIAENLELSDAELIIKKVNR